MTFIRVDNRHSVGLIVNGVAIFVIVVVVIVVVVVDAPRDRGSVARAGKSELFIVKFATHALLDSFVRLRAEELRLWWF